MQLLDRKRCADNAYATLWHRLAQELVAIVQYRCYTT
jgi:hypothetical protein